MFMCFVFYAGMAAGILRLSYSVSLYMTFSWLAKAPSSFFLSLSLSLSISYSHSFITLVVVCMLYCCFITCFTYICMHVSVSVPHKKINDDVYMRCGANTFSSSSCFCSFLCRFPYYMRLKRGEKIMPFIFVGVFFLFSIFFFFKFACVSKRIWICLYIWGYRYAMRFTVLRGHKQKKKKKTKKRKIKTTVLQLQQNKQTQKKETKIKGRKEEKKCL